MINADIQTVEYPFLKLPFEIAVKQFKQQRKLNEKEISQVLNSILQLKKEECFDKDKVKTSIDQLILRLKELKKKFNADFKEHDKLYDSCLKRIAHLKAILPYQKQSQLDYHSIRAKRLIVEELSRNGYFTVAKNISKAFKIKDYCDLEVDAIEEEQKILNDLKDKKIESAMEWCQQNHSRLEKLNSDFSYKLMRQQFVKLIQEHRRQDAQAYMRQNSKRFKDKHMKDIQKLCMFLIIYDRLEQNQQYQKYFQDERWNELQLQFKELSFALHSITSRSQFDTTLFAGIATLKTLNCTHKEFQNPQKCPVCSPSISLIAKDVPFTHKVTSQLICRITGQVMDEHNPPFITKTNQVFSEQGIERMKAEKQNRCPITGEEVNWNECRKIFLC